MERSKSPFNERQVLINQKRLDIAKNAPLTKELQGKLNKQAFTMEKRNSQRETSSNIIEVNNSVIILQGHTIHPRDNLSAYNIDQQFDALAQDRPFSEMRKFNKNRVHSSLTNAFSDSYMDASGQKHGKVLSSDNSIQQSQYLQFVSQRQHPNQSI